MVVAVPAEKGHSKDDALEAIDQSGVRPGQRWRHFKHGTVYQVMAVGIEETSLEPKVGYAGPDGVVWFRHLNVFTGLARQDQTLVSRFTLVDG